MTEKPMSSHLTLEENLTNNSPHRPAANAIEPGGVMIRTIMRVAAIPGALAASLLIATITPAQADAGGAYGGVEWNLRAGTSTTSTVILRVKKFGTGVPDRIPCWDSECSGGVTGGS